MEEELRNLKLTKARIFSDMEMLSSCSDKIYTELGRVQAKIMILEKKLLRETTNNLSNED